MIQSVSPRSPLHEAYQRLFAACATDQIIHGDGADRDGTALSLEVALRLNANMALSAQNAELAPCDRTISVDDWDCLFLAVATRLRRAVGERQDTVSDMPENSAALTTGQVQAIVLDCVDALGQLHAALKQQRGQRPAP